MDQRTVTAIEWNGEKWNGLNGKACWQHQLNESKFAQPLLHCENAFVATILLNLQFNNSSCGK